MTQMAQNSIDIIEDEEQLGLSDTTIEIIDGYFKDDDKLSKKAIKDITTLTKEFSASDWASLLAKIDDDRTLILSEKLRDQIPSEAFGYMDGATAELIFRSLSDDTIANIINDVDTDEALDLLNPYNEDEQKRILSHVARKTRGILSEGLTFEEDSVGRLMHRDFISVPEFWTVGKALDYFRGLKDDLPAELYDIYITDPRHHVVGQIPIVAVLRSDRKVKMADIGKAPQHTLTVDMDQEDAAYIFRQNALKSAPVIDEDDRLIGSVTLDDIADVIEEEAEEDILRLSGVAEDDLTRAVFGTVKSRFSWLALNLLTAILASLAIGLFEATLQEVVALAILMPIVASMGGNAGTQTLAVVVRSLATKELSRANMMRVVGKEMLVGFINGVGFAILCGGITYYWFSDPMIATIIAGAMIINLLMAGFAGALIPILIDKAKLDPAIASSVFLTTVTDIVGFVVFLGAASLFIV